MAVCVLEWEEERGLWNSAQFCYEPKTTLNTVVYQCLKGEGEIGPDGTLTVYCDAGS